MSQIDTLLHSIARGDDIKKAIDAYLKVSPVPEDPEPVKESHDSDQFKLLMNLASGGRSREQVNRAVASKVLGAIVRTPKEPKSKLFGLLKPSEKEQSDFHRKVAQIHLMRNLLASGLGKAQDYAADTGLAAGRYALGRAGSHLQRKMGIPDMSHLTWPAQVTLSPAPGPGGQGIPELPSSLAPQHLAAGKTHGSVAPPAFLPAPSPPSKFEPAEFLA